MTDIVANIFNIVVKAKTIFIFRPRTLVFVKNLAAE